MQSRGEGKVKDLLSRGSRAEGVRGWVELEEAEDEETSALWSLKEKENRRLGQKGLRSSAGWGERRLSVPRDGVWRVVPE